MPSSLHSGSDSLTQSAFLVWMPPSAHLRSDTHARLPFHKDRSSPCWLSDSHTWNALCTLGSSKPPLTRRLLHPAQALPPCARCADSPTPSLWMVSLVHKGLWLSMPMHAPHRAALWYPMPGHSSSKTLQPPQSLTSPARTLPSTGMPPHTSVDLTPTLPPPGDTLLALVRLRPRQLSYSDARLIQLRLQHPPLGHCGWPTPALGTRYGGPPSSAHLMASGPFKKEKRKGEEKDPIVPFGTNFSYLVCFFAFSFPKLSFSIPLLWASFYP